MGRRLLGLLGELSFARYLADLSLYLLLAAVAVVGPANEERPLTTYTTDLSAIHDPATNSAPPATFGDAIVDNFKAVGEAWTAHSPTYTNFSLGNGTVGAWFLQWGKRVEYRGTITMGTTSSVTGEFRVSLPVAPKASSDQVGTARAVDVSASSARNVGLAEISQATWGTSIHFASDGVGGWNATVPFTWANGDTLTWHITYEAA